MPEKITVLYVDDEEENLNAFRAYFRKLYTVYTSTNAIEAFELLRQFPVHILVADQRMPVTTGTEFLEKTIEEFPDTIRLLITGQSDIETVIDAINRGQITKYLHKPWDWESFRIIMENCSDIYKSRTELKNKNETLQKTNDELNRFVYSASHDLRSPLMSILGLVNLAKTETDPAELSEYFAHIETSVHKLDDYIKNIIDYYKNTRREEITESIDFKTLIDDVVHSLMNLDARVEFEINIDQQIEFWGDRFRIRVILSNLVSNAIKYQNPDEAKHLVKVNAIVQPEHVKLTVTDNGIGIFEEHLENIFKMFFRTPNTNHKQGTGIGLFIVKEALEKIGGTINIVSAPLKGSSFELLIPAKKSH